MFFRSIFLFFVCFNSSFLDAKVLVSIAPHQYFVKQIAGDKVAVNIMVPKGASAHTFEPTAKQVANAAESVIWLRIGEGFEERALPALKSHFPNLDIVDLRQGVQMISSGGCQCHAGEDPHIWLSLKEAITQAKTIHFTLSKHYPEYQEEFTSNLNLFLEELKAADEKITKQLASLKNRTLMVSHPAYGYFARDYNLLQLPIEFEGRDPSPKQLTRLLEEGKKLNTAFIFIQEQHDNRGAKLMAKQLNAEVIVLDPYSENYIENMIHIANSFAKQG